MDLFNYKAYTGIGSRETPGSILALMSMIAYKFALDGWVLRSGAAPGADTAFEDGAKLALDEEGVVRPEIYLPWKDFEGREKGYVARTEPQQEAYAIAEEYHPSWQYLKQGAKKLHARNVHQVLGYDVTRPEVSEFVVCWTKDGKGAGGTGQALRIAKGYNVPEIYDLYNEPERRKIKNYLNDFLLDD